MRVYKRTLTVTLKQKSDVQLMNLHMKHQIIQRTFKTADYSVSAKIS